MVENTPGDGEAIHSPRTRRLAASQKWLTPKPEAMLSIDGLFEFSLPTLYVVLLTTYDTAYTAFWGAHPPPGTAISKAIAGVGGCFPQVALQPHQRESAVAGRC